MWSIFKPEKQEVARCEDPKCKYQKSQIETEVLEPYPKILALNFNWSNTDVSSKDILKIFTSVRDHLAL